jgi:hypothetical protein
MADDPDDKTPLEAHTPRAPAPSADDADQLTLTDGQGDMLLSSTATFDGCLPLDTRIEPPEQRGPGRPKGSKNKTTDQLSKYLLAKGYVHPAEALAQLISKPAVELADELSISVKDGTVMPVDALKVQVAAAKELLPYFASKKPQDVQVDVQQRSVFIFGELPKGVEGETIDALSLDDFMQSDQ